MCSGRVGGRNSYVIAGAYSRALISRVFPFKCLLLSGNPASELLLDEVMLLQLSALKQILKPGDMYMHQGIPSSEFAPLALGKFCFHRCQLSVQQLGLGQNFDPPQMWQCEQGFSQSKICSVLSQGHLPANSDLAIAHSSLCHLPAFLSQTKNPLKSFSCSVSVY